MLVMAAERTTTERDLVKISGRGALVNLEIDDSVPVETACRTLRDRLASNRYLYAQGDVLVDIGQRILSDDAQERIRRVIESESGLNIKQFWCDPSVLAREQERITDLMALHTRTSISFHGEEQDGNSEPDELEPDLMSDDGETVEESPGTNRRSVPADIVRGTCRAGEVLTFPGNVVVIGNVNPGAQVIAQGDILVFGTLRGTAHAGAGGDSTAIILAMSSIAPQLRIGAFLADDEDGRGVAGRPRGDTDAIPIIARVQNGAVRVTPYLKNHSIDHGGNPNER